MEQKKGSEAVKGTRKYERRVKELTYQVGTMSWGVQKFQLIYLSGKVFLDFLNNHHTLYGCVVEISI